MGGAAYSASPLHGLKVLDFSVQLPGPLATLMLAEAGATVVKVERPGTGDIARGVGGAQVENVEFALLNRGKKSIVLDLKSVEGRATALRLAKEADVLVEQFRPGVMQRLGLGFDVLKQINEGLIYCSISGYGQDGPLAQMAGHDLNYVALSGMLSISVDGDGTPVLPPTQIADIGGGSFPAVLNILLALRVRDATGQGAYIDVAMAENLFAWMRRPLAAEFSGRAPLLPGQHPSAGGLARYNIYRTKDGAALSVAAIEEAFWQCFCTLIGLPEDERDDSLAPEAVKIAVASRIASRDASEWDEMFKGKDVCVELVQSVSDACSEEHFKVRGVFERMLRLHKGGAISALPVPISSQFRSAKVADYPLLGSTSADDPDLWMR